jgi:cytoskeletal protein RodZ
MSGKGNLKFLCAVVVVVLLLGGLGWFVYSNDKKVDELKQRYTQSDVPSQSVPSPHNVNAARTTAAASKESEQKVVDTLNITFRAVGLKRVSSEADQELAFNVLNEIRSSPYFDATNTVGMGEISPEVPLSEPPVKSEGGETPGTFSFKIVAKLKRPLTL